MSTFTRPAPWLRQFFTPSRTGFKEPGKLSDDVSLVQPYDGGGWPIDPGVNKTGELQSVVGASTQTVLFTTEQDEISRLVTVGAILDAGGVPAGLVHLDHSGGPSVPICEHFTLDTAYYRSMPLYAAIVGPMVRVRGFVVGGDASTQVTWRWMEYRVPVGTVFYA